MSQAFTVHGRSPIGPVVYAGRRCRRGVSLLEVQVALVILALALAGLCPLVFMQQRLMTRLDGRMRAYASYQAGPGGTWTWDATSPQTVYYVVPFTEPMALAFAQGTRQNPGDTFVALFPTTTVASVPEPVNTVSLATVDYHTNLSGVSAQVQVTP